MYKRLVKDMMNPAIHLELNLKESQKYVKQGRTYTSTIMNLEKLMWIVYEMDQNRTHRQLGLFAACEREILHIAQAISAPLEHLGRFSLELGKMDISAEERKAFEKVVQAAEFTEMVSYDEFWNMRGEISDRSEELLRDAAQNDPEQLKGACRDLNLGELLHTLHDNFHDSAAEMDEALKEIRRIEPDPPWGYTTRRKNDENMRSSRPDRENCDKKSILFSSLKICAEKIWNGCVNAEKAAEKAIMKYERIESRTAEMAKNNAEKKEKCRPSVRGKMGTLQMQQSERSERVAEDRGKGMMR